MTIGSAFHVIPHDLGEMPGEDHFLNEKAKSVVLLVRMHPDEMRVSEGREDWSYHGIVAYSKVCTHVGCPVALYEQNRTADREKWLAGMRKLQRRIFGAA